MNNYKVQNILNWFNNYKDIKIKIESDTQCFIINLENSMIPHLIGLHYMVKRHKDDIPRIKGQELYDFVKDNNFSDEEIFKMIRKHFSNKDLNYIKYRINNIKTMINNLDKCKIVEMTSPKSNIESQYLLLLEHDGKMLHLGIKDFILNASMETFLVTRPTNRYYYKYSTINERVTNLSAFNEYTKQYETISFSKPQDINNIKCSLFNERIRKIENKIEKTKLSNRKDKHYLQLSNLIKLFMWQNNAEKLNGNIHETTDLYNNYRKVFIEVLEKLPNDILEEELIQNKSLLAFYNYITNTRE